MTSTFKLIFKTFLGGILGGIIFLGLGSVKAFIEAIIQAARYGDLQYWASIPIFTLLGGWYIYWFGGDFVLLAVLTGAEISLWKNVRGVISHQYSIDVATKTTRILALALSAIAILCFIAKVNALFQIQTRYMKFCSLVLSKDYSSAYQYLSPEYRDQKNLDQFVEDDFFVYELYCPTHGESFEFTSSFGKSASVFPYPFTYLGSFAELAGGPVIYMEKTSGEWFLTGETAWFAD